MKKILISGLCLVSILALLKQATATARSPISVEQLEKLRPDLGFSQTIPDTRFKNLQMIGRINRNGVDEIDGRILRVLRLKPITDAIEHRYLLPEGLILAMTMQESNGAALLPNGGDDGGIGDCHMQPVTARKFGLRTYQNNNQLVDREHGKALRRLIEKERYDIGKLVVYDDRFHPILNLDAVGRMITAYIQMPPPKARSYKGKSPLEAAMFRYSGRNEYYGRVMNYRSLLLNPKRIALVRSRFNSTNPSLLINGKSGNFDAYLKACWKCWDNFGLQKYKKLPLYKTSSGQRVYDIHTRPFRI